MTRSDFRLIERLRVRWAEIDSQNIVFNGHYLMYFDTTVAGYWRALGLPYALTMAQLGGDLFVRKATVTYEASAHYDDLLDIGMRCARLGSSSLTFEGAVFRQDRLLVSGELVYVFADPASQTSRPVPAALREVLQAFEAGEPMLDVQVGNWRALGESAQAVRTQVFVDEQRISADLEHDAADAQAVHAVAFNRLGVAVGTGRLVAGAGGVARIGRMASLQPVRGAGVARSVLNALMQAARELGLTQVVLHAQSSARGFYERAGFEANGEGFEEAGIAHVTMTRPL